MIESVSTPTVPTIALRYIIGGVFLSILIHALLSGGWFLAMAWVYGWTMLPLTLFFAVMPPILSAPGAIAARGLDLPQRMMSAIASAALLALLGSVALNRSAMRAEHLIFMPVAAVLALPACLVDWAVTKRERLRQTPCWLQVVLSIALALAMIWIIQGVASILRDPPKPVWL